MPFLMFLNWFDIKAIRHDKKKIIIKSNYTDKI